MRFVVDVSVASDHWPPDDWGALQHEIADEIAQTFARQPDTEKWWVDRVGTMTFRTRQLVPEPQPDRELGAG